MSLKVLKSFCSFALCLFAVLALSLPCRADSEIDPQVVKKVENYFQNLTTMKAEFKQISNDGSRLTGDFSLSRPGKLRFQYNEIDDFIVADGLFIYYYDAQMKQQTNALIGSTLADFILRDNITLSGEIKVEDTLRQNGMTYITLSQSENPAAGVLKLVFQEKPFELRAWRVIDSLGKITDVYLEGIETGVTFPERTFVYSDPEHGVTQKLNK